MIVKKQTLRQPILGHVNHMVRLSPTGKQEGSNASIKWDGIYSPLLGTTNDKVNLIWITVGSMQNQIALATVKLLAISDVLFLSLQL